MHQPGLGIDDLLQGDCAELPAGAERGGQVQPGLVREGERLGNGHLEHRGDLLPGAEQLLVLLVQPIEAVAVAEVVKVKLLALVVLEL